METRDYAKITGYTAQLMPRTKHRNIALQQTMDEFASDGKLSRDVSRLQDERESFSNKLMYWEGIAHSNVVLLQL